MEHGGIGRKGLKIWGFLFLGAYILGRVLREFLLQGARGSEILFILGSGSGQMYLAAASLILEAAATCGVILFSAMTVEGIRHTKHPGHYLLRLAILAVCCEIPFDLLNSGKFLETELQNPMFGLLTAAVACYYLDLGTKKQGSGPVFGILLTGAAVVWCGLLRPEYGIPMVITTEILWLFRKKPERWSFAGVLASAVSILFSPFFLAAPMGALVLHFYHGDSWEDPDRRCYYGVFFLMTLGALACFLY